MKIGEVSAAFGGFRRPIVIVVAVLAANLAVWALALSVFRTFPTLQAAAVLAFSFGLRHAIDADHIAAIDSATRVMVQGDRRPLAAGFWFASGHSTVVMILTAAVIVLSRHANVLLHRLLIIGNDIGPLVSGSLLLLLAVTNTIALFALLRKSRSSAAALNCWRQRWLSGFLPRIERCWMMYPLGILFGLGFDTATEIGLLGLSAIESSKGLGLWQIMLLPSLFAAGMLMLDTLDGILMVGAYAWALEKPSRHRRYNVTLTIISIAVATIVSAIEIIGSIAGSGHNYFNSALSWFSDGSNFELLGGAIVVVFGLTWLAFVARNGRKQCGGHPSILGSP